MIQNFNYCLVGHYFVTMILLQYINDLDCNNDI